jgi:hypothetical protein
MQHVTPLAAGCLSLHPTQRRIEHVPGTAGVLCAGVEQGLPNRPLPVSGAATLPHLCHAVALYEGPRHAFCVLPAFNQPGGFWSG